MIFFNIFIEIVLFLIKPVLFIILKKDDFLQRYYIKQKKINQHNVWVHAASVGEINAIKPLLKSLPKTVLISCMTQTGKKTAEALGYKTIILPFDTKKNIQKVLSQVKPKLLLIAETEIWPNLITESKKNGCKIILVNGRMSAKSLKRYSLLKALIKKVLANIDFACCQSSEDACRFKQLGVEKALDCQNLKFCIDLPEHNVIEVKKQFGFEDDKKIIVFGSSRPGEEKLIADFVKNNPNYNLILAPRHLKRLAEIEAIFAGLNCSKLSKNKKTQVKIIDEMGLLTKAYSIASVAIVGGSFYNFGGHNPLEPAFYGVPIIMGNFYESCRYSVKALQKHKGILISDVSNFEKDLLSVLKNNEKANELGKNAKKTLEENSNSLKLHLNILKDYINA